MSVEVVGVPKDFAQERFVEHVKILHTENCKTITLPDHFLRIAATKRGYISREYFGRLPGRDHTRSWDFQLQASILFTPSPQSPDQKQVDTIVIVDENGDSYQIALADNKIVNVWWLKDDKQILLKTKDEVRQLSTIGWLVDSLLLENSTTCDFVLDYSWRFIDPYELIEQ